MTGTPSPGTPAATLRPYRDGDLADVYDVCLRTADAGGDARGIYADGDVVADVYAGPYVHLEPDLALVLDDGTRVVGYVVGTSDTQRFVRACREVWIPRLADRHPAPPSPPLTTPDERMVALHHHPERMLVPELADHPAHLHVDLLPSHQGAGHGRALVEAFLAAAARAGAPAVHLGVSAANTRARGFYDRLGFAPIPVAGSGGTTYLGRSTT